MNKLLFITFYGLVEYIEDIYNSFDKVCNNNNYDIDIIDYPYLKIKHDTFIDRELNNDECVNYLVDYIKDNKINYVFWFILPEQTIFEKIKRLTKTKFIFYNFDDPKSFSFQLIKYAKSIDYFINPLQQNKLKYELLFDKKIYIIPKYIFKEYLLSSTFDKNKKDILTIIVDDEYSDMTTNDIELLKSYITKIKNHNIKNDSYEIKLYGFNELENMFPDIYDSNIDEFFEYQILSQSNKLVLIDIIHDLQKIPTSFSNKLDILNIDVYTNSNNTYFNSTNFININLNNCSIIFDSTNNNSSIPNAKEKTNALDIDEFTEKIIQLII
jgi:hypothetical protein